MSDNIKAFVLDSCHAPGNARGISLSQRPPLWEILSEAGVYSYCAVLCLALHKLFPDKCDKQFREQCLRDFSVHLNMGAQVKPVMLALLSGEAAGEFEPYINILKDESVLESSFMKVIQDLVIFAVHRGVYDARMRVFILYTARKLSVSTCLVEMYEHSVVQFLSQEAVEQTDEEKKEIAKRERNKKIKRYFMIGIATVGGGAVLGLTGGLAAPLVAAGAGAVIGGAGAAALGSAAGIALISSVMGLAGAGLTGYKMKKRVGEIEEFAFDELTKGKELHVTIGVSGWLTDDKPEAILHPWRTLFNSREQYVLRYETGYLVELGRAMDYLFSFAVSMAAQEALKYTILSGLIAAVTWPATLIMVAGVIDNPWGVCTRRSAQVGRHLAEVLIQRQQGKRPVTLIGFSLGARVIYYCLKEMSTREGCEGIIENAVLLGAPVPASVEDWRPFGRIVAGKIVNGYCRGDWLLKFVHRTSSATMKIAGLQPIEWNDRRMYNYDLSGVVSGHTDYNQKMDQILKTIGINTMNDSEQPDMKKSNSFQPRSDVAHAYHKESVNAQLKRARSDSCLTLQDHLPGVANAQSFESILSTPGSQLNSFLCHSDFSLFRSSTMSRSTSGVSQCDTPYLGFVFNRLARNKMTSNFSLYDDETSGIASDSTIDDFNKLDRSTPERK